MNAELERTARTNKLAEESELAVRMKLKEQSALSDVMERYGNDVYRTAYLLLGDHHLAEDVSQDTFLTAYRKIGQYDGRGAFGGWLRTIAVNHCRSRMRRAQWKRLFLQKWDNLDTVSADPGPEERSMRKSLLEEIARLPYSYREVILLYYYYEWSIREIAERLQDREGTVKSRLHRAREQLRYQLGKEDAWHVFE